MRFAVLFPLTLIGLGVATLFAGRDSETIALATRVSHVSEEALPVFFMPVEGALVADVPDTFGDPRGSDRVHQGIDILAPRGTPVLAAAPGTVQRLGNSERGGLTVTILGNDGLRYFYAHLDSFADGLERGRSVSVDTVIGHVGNTGNAAATAPHLHFEAQRPGSEGRYSWQAFDPLPYLLDRSSDGGP